MVCFIYLNPLNCVYRQCFFIVSRLFIQEMTKQYFIFLVVSYTLLFYSFEVSKIWCSKVETNLFHFVFHVCDKRVYLTLNFYLFLNKVQILLRLQDNSVNSVGQIVHTKEELIRQWVKNQLSYEVVYSG